MRIGVLGTGMVGRTIAGALAERGHDVRVGSRTAGDDAVVFADAAAHGEVVFNCTNGASRSTRSRPPARRTWPASC